MHELSIAQNLVELVCDVLERDGAQRVLAVQLRVGALAGVAADALRFSYDIAVQNTPLEGSRLEIQTLPVMIHCPRCDRSVELPGLRPFRCPECDTPSATILQGRELEVASIEVEDVEPSPKPAGAAS